MTPTPPPGFGLGGVVEARMSFQAVTAEGVFRDARRKLDDMLRCAEGLVGTPDDPGTRWLATFKALHAELVTKVEHDRRAVVDRLLRHGTAECSLASAAVSIPLACYRAGLRVGKLAAMLEPKLRRRFISDEAARQPRGPREKTLSEWFRNHAYPGRLAKRPVAEVMKEIKADLMRMPKEDRFVATEATVARYLRALRRDSGR